MDLDIGMALHCGHPGCYHFDSLPSVCCLSAFFERAALSVRAARYLSTTYGRLLSRGKLLPGLFCPVDHEWITVSFKIVYSHSLNGKTAGQMALVSVETGAAHTQIPGRLCVGNVTLAGLPARRPVMPGTTRRGRYRPVIGDYRRECRDA